MKKKLIILISSLLFAFSATAQKESNAQLANQFLKSGQYEKASHLYSNLYNKHKSTNYYQGLLDCYLALDQYLEAEKLVKKHLKKYNKNSSVIVDYAHLLMLNGEDKKAQKKFNQAFDLLVQYDQFVGVTANKFNKYNYLEYAVEAYKIGLQNPSKTSYRFQLARIYGQLGEIELMYENYLELVLSNQAYLQSVKTTLGRTINTNPENENNQRLKELLLQKIQKSNNQHLNEILIWLFIQEKNFDAAFNQEKAMDQRLKLDQKNIFDLAKICRKNKAFDTALHCYNYIVEIGTNSSYYLDAQLAIFTVRKELLENSKNSTPSEWIELEQSYIEGLNKIGKTSYSILLLRDLAQIQALRLHHIEKASATIKEALNISAASTEDIAACKLIYADILLLQNEIWDAILMYSQVEKAYKHDLLGHEAKYRRAKIAYYQGDFDWAQAQLDVLKKSTSKLIANNAMELSLLIQDNLNLDTTTTTMHLFSKADLYLFQNKLDLAYQTLDSIVIDYPNHSLIDEALFKQYTIKMAAYKYEDASELLEQIIAFYPFDILADDAKFALAQLYENQFNKLDQAIDLYQDLLTNHKDSFYLAEARKRYRTLTEQKNDHL